MKEIVIYVTKDEQEFTTREDAEAHEKGLESANKINEFLAARGISGRKATEYRKLIMAWEAFCERDTGQDLPEEIENE